MAKKQKAFDKGRENVAAALDSLEGVSTTVAKSTAIVKRRMEELDDLVVELEERLQEAVSLHQREMAELREQYTRETTALTTKLEAAEDKLRKVQQTLA